MKQLLITLLTMFLLNWASAQTHNPGPNSNCKLNKNYWPNSEKMACPACDKTEKQETEAKAAEDQRRADAIAARAKAEQEALNKAYQDKLAAEAEEKIRLAEEKERLKKKAEESRQRLDQLRNQYSQNTKGGNSITGQSVNYIEELTAFNDNSNKTYGLKLLDSIIFLENYPVETQYVTLRRLTNTNFFILTISKKNEKYGYGYFNNTNSMMNMFGEIIKIGEYELFNSISYNDESKILEVTHFDESLNNKHPEQLDPSWTKGHKTNIYPTSAELIRVHEALVESSIAAFRAKYAGSNGVIISNPKTYLYYGSGKIIKADLNLKVLEIQSGIVYTYSY